MALTRKQRRPGATRPFPPGALVGDGAPLWPSLVPASDLKEWVHAQILEEGGALHNPDHQHLISADLVFLWASQAFAKSGRTVLGQAEQVMIRTGGWQKARQEQQLIEWFGRVPAFLITLAADYCAICSDAEFCALLEHELYHVAQLPDEFGAPAFFKDGRPKLGIRGHDVEEFVGVVRRYGASEEVAQMVAAAKKPAEVAQINIARACGCCLRVA